MHYKRHKPAHRKLRSEHRHGWSSEGKQRKIDAISDEFQVIRNNLTKGGSGEVVSRPIKAKKKKGLCNVTKDDHEYKLVVPRFIRSFKDYNVISVEDYYKRQQEKKSVGESFFDRVLYYYECIHCHKNEYNFSNEAVPNKKIKKIVA